MLKRTGLSLTLSLALAGCRMGFSISETQDGDNLRTVGTLEGVNGTVFHYDEGLYRGGDIATQKGMDELKRLGVKTVFSVTPTEQEREFALRSGIRLVEVLFTKSGVPQHKLPVYLKEMKEAEKPLYVHCHSGKNCGGALLAAYRVHVQGWDFEKARSEFVSLGGKDSKYPALMESVRKK